MYTNRKEGGGAGWQGDFVEELLVESWKRERRLVKKWKISHGMTRKNTEAAEAKTRKNAEAAEAKTRKNAEAAAEELATE